MIISRSYLKTNKKKPNKLTRTKAKDKLACQRLNPAVINWIRLELPNYVDTTLTKARSYCNSLDSKQTERSGRTSSARKWPSSNSPAASARSFFVLTIAACAGYTGGNNKNRTDEAGSFQSGAVYRNGRTSFPCGAASSSGRLVALPRFSHRIKRWTLMQIIQLGLNNQWVDEWLSDRVAKSVSE